VKALAAAKVALIRFNSSRAFGSRCGLGAAVFGEEDSSAATSIEGDQTMLRKPASEPAIVSRRCIFMVGGCVGLVEERLSVPTLGRKVYKSSETTKIQISLLSKNRDRGMRGKLNCSSPITLSGTELQRETTNTSRKHLLRAIWFDSIVNARAISYPRRLANSPVSPMPNITSS
jgi:hypothetical protein